MPRETEESKRLRAEAAAREEKEAKDAEARRQKIYKTLLRRAGIKGRKKHLGHLADIEASARLATGREDPARRVWRRRARSLKRARRCNHDERRSSF
mmetsp:Transcript_1233/g.3687  ORF Transcript_1233/g.3687 Transcript_1233/m.3687 type:complete len:97 (-) Transcript_1233:1140-1430(-)